LENSDEFPRVECATTWMMMMGELLRAGVIIPMSKFLHQYPSAFSFFVLFRLSESVFRVPCSVVFVPYSVFRP
jgi:hypothetical protein